MRRPYNNFPLTLTMMLLVEHYMFLSVFRGARLMVHSLVSQMVLRRWHATCSLMRFWMYQSMLHEFCWTTIAVCFTLEISMGRYPIIWV